MTSSHLRVRRSLERLAWPLHLLAWKIQGLSRCPRCRSTWEPKAVMDDYQGGVCHDCHGDQIMREINAEDSWRYREALQTIADNNGFIPLGGIEEFAQRALEGKS